MDGGGWGRGGGGVQESIGVHGVTAHCKVELPVVVDVSDQDCGDGAEGISPWVAGPEHDDLGDGGATGVEVVHVWAGGGAAVPGGGTVGARLSTGDGLRSLQGGHVEQGLVADAWGANLQEAGWVGGWGDGSGAGIVIKRQVCLVLSKSQQTAVWCVESTTGLRVRAAPCVYAAYRCAAC